MSVASRVNCGGSEITVTMTIAIKIFPTKLLIFNSLKISEYSLCAFLLACAGYLPGTAHWVFERGACMQKMFF